ncbi:MAG TPA: hypothetical protein VFT22_36595 [Kofleriaceae bacterium]|nr:hypothetical protein [Kofleriaceae bacterium]
MRARSSIENNAQARPDLPGAPKPSRCARATDDGEALYTIANTKLAAFIPAGLRPACARPL